MMLITAFFISTFAEIFGIWILFDRFKFVQGWTFPELTLIYGIVHMGFAIAESLARGFDNFSQILKQGDFDRILLRPVGTLFQVASSDIHFMKLGRFFQGLLVLLWGLSQLQIPLNLFNALVLGVALIGTSSLFYGLIILNAALAFWSTETLELINIATFGGVEACQYPITIYPKGFRFIFTFIIPLACAAYYPVAGILHHEAIPIGVLVFFPLSGMLFLALSCQLWSVGVKHYRSTGN